MSSGLSGLSGLSGIFGRIVAAVASALGFDFSSADNSQYLSLV
jgi:hypothetical protein